MSFADLPCNEFLNELSQKTPVPGGGGASALVGAIGIALGSMVGSLTVGKKKYKEVEADIILLMDKAELIRNELVRLIDEDARAFEPLSKAYGLPKDTKEEIEYRDRVMEDGLKCASETPLCIMEKCCEAIDLIEEFAKKGSSLAISDAGVAALCAKSALLGAAFNVYINTGLMKDRECADKYNAEADSMIVEYGKKADVTYNLVMERVRK